MQCSEYDAFGPWIYEIDERHPMPPLFVPCCAECKAPLMQIKIPREIERRKATPDMDLYDYLISAEPEELLIFKRVGHEVERSRVAYRTIERIQISHELLRGVLTLYVGDGTVSIPFNTVSTDVVLQFVQLIRQRYCAPERVTGADFAAGLPDERELSNVLFVNLLQELRAGGEILLAGAWQLETPLRYTGDRILKKLRYKLQKPMLRDAIHLATPGELLIIEREQQRGKSKIRGYGYRYIYIPWENLRGICIDRDQNHAGMDTLSLELSSGRVELRFETENAGLSSFYRAACGRELRKKQ